MPSFAVHHSSSAVGEPFAMTSSSAEASAAASSPSAASAFHAERLAAGADGGEQQRRVRGREDKGHALRRLLEQLQEGVLRLGIHGVRVLHDIRLRAALVGHDGRVLRDGAYDVDAYLALAAALGIELRRHADDVRVYAARVLRQARQTPQGRAPSSRSQSMAAASLVAYSMRSASFGEATM